MKNEQYVILSHDEALAVVRASLGCSAWQAAQALCGHVGGIPAVETFADRPWPRSYRKSSLDRWLEEHKQALSVFSPAASSKPSVPALGRPSAFDRLPDDPMLKGSGPK